MMERARAVDEHVPTRTGRRGDRGRSYWPEASPTPIFGAMEATRKHPFSRELMVRGEEGTAIVRLAWTRPRATLQLDGEDHTVRAVGVTHATYLLEHSDRELLRAERVSSFPSIYELRADNRALRLRPRLFTRTFAVHHGDRVIGRIRPRRALSRSFVLEGLDELSRTTRLFLLTVALLRLRRRAQASGG